MQQFLKVFILSCILFINGIAAADSISSNPAAVNISTGTGALGEYLGLKKESGVRLGGAFNRGYQLPVLWRIRAKKVERQ